MLKKKILTNLASLLLLFLVLLAVDYWRSPPRHVAIPAQLYDLAGQPHNLHSPQPQLLYIWGSWCVFCRLTSPAVEELAADYPVVSVAWNSGSGPEVKRYMAAHSLHFPVVNDPEGHLTAALGVKYTPTAIILKDGKILYSTSGWSSGWGLRFRLWLAQYL